MSPTDIRPCVPALLLVGICVWVTSARAQQGHVVTGDRVVVNRASHWAAWQGGASLIEAVGDGVRPLLQRKDVNVALDASRFSVTGPGGVTAPSNPGAAAHIVDGDTLGWGPDPQSPLRDWWVEINLGRLVVVRRIIVRFAEEGFGDPFLQFKVLGWRRGPPTTTRMSYTLRGSDIPRFWEVGRTDRPNKTERVFEFVPRPTQEANELFTGDALSHIRVVAIASDSSQAEQIGEATYFELPDSRRGKVEYYRRERSGRETRISAAAFERISADRRGPVRYFRQETPRIAEIEVITAGDNVNMGLVERSGTASIETQSEPKDVTASISDGDYGTSHSGPIFDFRAYRFIEDLGALLWIDTMHFLTDGPQPIDHFTLDVSDGALAPDGSILWTRTADASVAGTAEFTGGSAASLTASEGVRFREFRVAPTRVRFLRTTFRNPLRVLSNIGINEIMLYGGGFVPEVVLTSDLIRFDSPKNLGAISWTADTPEGTQVWLQTRTGNELDVDTLYFDASGNSKTTSQYRRLPKTKKGDIRFDLLPAADWSTWSRPYTRSGVQISSPSPRRYMEIRATLRTDRADGAATMHSLSLNLSDPVADDLRGEVFPVRVPAAAVSQEFRYYIRPLFASANQSFDEVLITATAGTRFDAVVGVRSGTDDAFLAASTTDLPPVVLTTAADSLHLRLPRRIGSDTELIEIRFLATIFGNTGSFRGFAREAAAGDWQRIDEGDATDLVRSSTITVLVEGSELISSLGTDSQVLSPNGDGINDEATMEFSVTRLAAPTPVVLRIYDLGGRRVRQVEELRSDPRGRYTLRWDGKDRGGQLVPPGVYLARIEIDQQSENQVTRQRLLHVVY
jgi:hypothetical protein